MSEELMTADLLDLIDTEPEQEEQFPENPERAALNVAVVKSRETVRLTAARYAHTGAGDYHAIERAEVLAALAERAAAEGILSDDDEQCAVAKMYADNALQCIETFAVEPSNMDEGIEHSRNRNRVILK